MKKVRRVSAREGYDLWAEDYDGTDNPVVAMDSRHTLSVLDPRPGERILDAGCGTGRCLEPMISVGAEPVGMDFSEGMLAVARRRHSGVTLVMADLQSTFPFEDGEFDAVLCALIGEHLDEPLFALRKMRRVLRPGGRLVFSVYHPEMAAAGKEAHFERSGVEYRLGARRYTVDEYERLLAEAGFERATRREFSGDELLVEEVPSAAGLLGFPVLLVIEADRSD